MSKRWHCQHSPQASLLCHAGLSMAYIIPIACFFFSRNLKHDRLRNLTVCRKLLERWGSSLFVLSPQPSAKHHIISKHDNNTLQHVVSHPVLKNDPLFILFEPNHPQTNLLSFHCRFRFQAATAASPLGSATVGEEHSAGRNKGG